MPKKWTYKDKEYSSSWLVRNALGKDGKLFGPEPEEGKVEFWAALGVTENMACQANSKIDQVAAAAKCCCEQNSAAIAGLQALVSKITQTVVPTSAICPEVMPRFNSWTAPTTTTPAA